MITELGDAGVMTGGEHFGFNRQAPRVAQSIPQFGGNETKAGEISERQVLPRDAYAYDDTEPMKDRYMKKLEKLLEKLERNLKKANNDIEKAPRRISG